MTPKRMYPVPAGARVATCRGCDAPIYWITTPRGKKMPVDCDVEGGHAPSGVVDPRQRDAFDATVQSYDGVGVSHFETCSDAASFSRRTG